MRRTIVAAAAALVAGSAGPDAPFDDNRGAVGRARAGPGKMRVGSTGRGRPWSGVAASIVAAEGEPPVVPGAPRRQRLRAACRADRAGEGPAPDRRIPRPPDMTAAGTAPAATIGIRAGGVPGGSGAAIPLAVAVAPSATAAAPDGDPAARRGRSLRGRARARRNGVPARRHAGVAATRQTRPHGGTRT